VIPVVQALHQQFKTYDVVVTGHSLGAALATLCMVDLHENNVPAYIWDYGRPRVGSQGFSMLSMQTALASFRHVNQRDTVPHLPLEAMGFFHAPTEVWNHKTAWHVCSSTNGEDPSCSDSQYLDTSST
jgi:predicted lipase